MNKNTSNEKLEELFPEFDCPIQPIDERITVQVQSARTKTNSGLFLAQDTQDAEKWHQQTAKVVALGERAFTHKNGLRLPDPFHGYKVGDYVRIPMFGADKVEVRTGHDQDTVLFATYKWYEVIGKITGDPLSIKTII